MMDPITKHLLEADQIIARIEALEAQARTHEPLFVATVNQRGQIVIRDDVRKRNVIVPGDRVAVYHLEKVEE